MLLRLKRLPGLCQWRFGRLPALHGSCLRGCRRLQFLNRLARRSKIALEEPGLLPLCLERLPGLFQRGLGGLPGLNGIRPFRRRWLDLLLQCLNRPVRRPKVAFEQTAFLPLLLECPPGLL